MKLNFHGRKPVDEEPLVQARHGVDESLEADKPEGIKAAQRRHELDAPVNDFEFEGHVEVVVNFAVNGKVVETAIAKGDSMRHVGVEIIAGKVRHADEELRIGRADAVYLREGIQDAVGMLQEMIGVDGGELVVPKGPGELIEVVDDVHAGQGYPVNAQATGDFVSAAPNVEGFGRFVCDGRANLGCTLRCGHGGWHDGGLSFGNRFGHSS